MENLTQFLRSRRFIGSLIAIACIAIVAFAYFYPDDAQGNVLRQHDTQQGIAVGQEVKAYREATGHTARWTNSIFSGMPTFQISPTYPSDSLLGWVNTVMGLGLPAPANLLAMMALGFFILLMAMRMRWYVALIGSLAYAFSSYFIIIIGAGHIWKFVTLAYVPPTIAGVILCYRGRYLAGGAMAAFFAMMQVASNHVQMTYYFLMVIAAIAIAYLVRAIRTRAMPRWIKATVVLAVAGALAAGANLPSLYNTYEYAKQTMRGNHSELSAPDAAQATGGLDRDYITQYSYGQAESFSLLIPNVKGGASMKPEKGSGRMLTLSDTPKAQKMLAEGQIDQMTAQYLSYMSQYFGEPEGTNGPVYVGALIVALFLLGCVIVKGPLKWALAVMTVLSVLLALGRNCMWLTDLMIDWMPMYAKFRTVESILVIAEFTMPLLAAMALQRIVTDRDASRRYMRPMLWCFGITAGICLLGWIFPGIFGSAIADNDRQIDAMITQQLTAQGYDPAVAAQFSLANPVIYDAVEGIRHSMVSADALRSLLFILAGLGTMLLFMLRRTGLAVTVSIIGILVAADLFTINKRYLDTESFLPARLAAGEPFPLTDADRAILADTTTHYRVMDIGRFWQPDPSYRHRTIGGYHAAKLTRYQDMIDRHLDAFTRGTQDDADWEVLNMLNARYIIGPDGQVIQNPEAMGNAWIAGRIDYVEGADAEMDALQGLRADSLAVADRAFEPVLGHASPRQPGDTIRLTAYAPDRLTYAANTAAGGVAVFSEVYFPWGWHATIDGAPAEIGRVNYLLRAMRLPAGQHTVEMWFDPDSLRHTTTAAYISIILIYLAGAAAIAFALLGMSVAPAATPGRKS